MGLKAVASGGGGGGGISGSGTPGKLAKFTGATALGDSLLSESGTTITSAATAETFGSAQTWTVGAPNSQALVVLSNAGLERTLVLDTISRAVGVGVPTTPATLLHASDGVTAFAGTTGAGVRLDRASEALFSSSDGTRSFRAGITGATAVVGTSTAHDLLLQRDNVTAATLQSGAIASVTLTAGGAGYTNGTYSQQALTGGTGSGATADIIVAGGIVTICVLRSPGTGYAAADALSCATIGAGAGFVATVATIAQTVNGSGNLTALGRIGAGTATPRAALDAVGGTFFSGGSEVVTDIVTAAPAFDTSNQYAATAVIGTVAVNGSLSGYNSHLINPLNVVTSAQNIRGIYTSPRVISAGAGNGYVLHGIVSNAYRIDAADVATGPSLYAGRFTVGIISSGSATTTALYGVSAQILHNQAAHTTATATFYDTTASFTAGTISTLYGLRLRNAGASTTITNRWGISQEDTLASNQFSAVTNTFSGIVRATGSTAGAPAFSTPADTDTGLYFPSANTVRIGTGGSPGLEIDSTQNLKFNSGFGSASTAYGCRAWVNFDGTMADTFAGGASTVTRIAASTTATVTTTTAHGLVTGNRVYPTSGVAPNTTPSAGYIVTVLTSTTFTITTVATTALAAVAIAFAGKLIRGSGNVSSIADIGTGLYSINFITAMPDINYAWAGAKQQTATNTSAIYDTFTVIAGLPSLPLRTANVLSIACYDGGVQTTSPNVNIAVFR